MNRIGKLAASAATGGPRFSARLRDIERRTRAADPEVVAALARRWDELPAGAQTPAQMLGRKLAGCEGTHGVFPACNFGCQPCYLSANANRVRVDGEHTVAEVGRQMAFLRERRGPAQYAQLIGGEVSLLPPEAHAEALEVMRRYDRMPMSFSHGDFDYDYLEKIAVRPDGTARFDLLSFAIHIDSTMRGRRGMRQASCERDLHPERRRVRDMFNRLTAEHGVRTHLAHNMTVTPDNLGEVADVVRVCRDLGYRMCSFQPAAMVGDERRWDDYRVLTDDAVWSEVERGAGARLPYKALQVGDLRCNRVTYGVWSGARYLPLLDDTDPRDLRARDVLLSRLPGNLLFTPRALAALRVLRALLGHPRDIPPAVGWAVRFAARLGIRAIGRNLHPTTYVMHSFMDAADVAPAWDLLQQGVRATDAVLLATQERLEACAYGMAHPDRGEIIPACVQHSVYDEAENAELGAMLPIYRRRE